MKFKIIGLGILTTILFSCSTKNAVVKETPPPVSENKAIVSTENKAFVMTAELAAGQSLYENNCAKCHKLYTPSAFKKEDWPSILSSMQKNTKLDDTQMASISDYIHSQL